MLAEKARLDLNYKVTLVFSKIAMRQKVISIEHYNPQDKMVKNHNKMLSLLIFEFYVDDSQVLLLKKEQLFNRYVDFFKRNIIEDSSL